MKIQYLRSAYKDVKKIREKHIKTKLAATIRSISTAHKLTDIKGVKKLSGHPHAYRIRIGDYRLGFYLENEIMIIARFVKRNDIYKLFP